MAISIDLRAKVIDPEQKVWIVFPGTGRRFLTQFMRQNIMFLDMPGTQFTAENGLLPMSAYRRKSVKDIVRSNITLSHELSIKIIEDKIGYATQEIDRDLSNYVYRPEELGNKYNTMVGSAAKFFVGMKKGDLVLIPGKGGAFSNVHIAEVSTDFDPEDKTYLPKYRREPIQLRKIRVSPQTATRRDFSDSVYKKLSRPPAVQWITQEEDLKSVYDVAYENYVYGDSSRALIYAKDYDGKDPTAINDFNDVTKFLIAAYNCYLQGNTEALRNATDIQAFSNTYFDRDLVNNYTLDFHSPGQFGLYPSRREIAAFLTSITALSLASGLSGCMGEKVSITNSLEKDPEYSECVENAVDFLIENISSECASQTDKKTNNAKADIGISTPAQVTNE